MTKADFVTDVVVALNEKHAETERRIGYCFSVLRAELEGGRKVTWPRFGTFKVIERLARKWRNPKTGETIDIPASKTVKFTAAKDFHDAINGIYPKVKG